MEINWAVNLIFGGVALFFLLFILAVGIAKLIYYSYKNKESIYGKRSFVSTLFRRHRKSGKR
jgi:hypothetical protein